MGDARRKNKLLGVRFKELQAHFDNLGIDTSKPGFYDDPRYLAYERSHPLFTEAYAEWVQVRPRTPQYDAHVRDVVPRLADIITARLERHKWYGGCIAITGIATRIMDELGVFNAPVSGSAAVYAPGDSRHFAVIDDLDGAGYETGHMWIVAPPFDIVDLTLYYQRWEGDKFQRLIPPQILATGSRTVRPRVRDMVAPEVLYRFGQHPDSFPIPSDQTRILKTFPAQQVQIQDIDIRYVPAGIRIPQEGIEGVNKDENQGVSAKRIWEEDVAPAFGLA
ncbi:hypothetical protein [Bosea beijingensis]